jgi:hypothetical protein
MAVADVIRLLRVNPVYRNRVVHTEISDPVLPKFGTLETPLFTRISVMLST